MGANWPQLLCTVIIAVFILMVTCLVGFHTYLAASNQTTCELQVGETASWEKISYLKIWPEELGSPFSKGCLRNLQIYCCIESSDSLQEWRMPERLPEGYAQRPSMC